MQLQIMIARTILITKIKNKKSNGKNFPKTQKSTYAVSSAVWNHLSQVFKFCKAEKLL